MRSLHLRLVLSHVAVAALTGLILVWLTLTLAPPFADSVARRRRGPGPGPVREQLIEALNTALAVGFVGAVIAAAVAGVVISFILVRPLRDMQDAARALATGDYAVSISPPGTSELAALAADIQFLGDSLRTTEDRRRRLLADVAHEMRTPLTVIDGRVEGMVDGLIESTPENLGMIGAEVRRLTRLTEDLSTLSRMDEGRLSILRSPTDVGDVVCAAAERLRPQFDDAGVGLDVQCESVQARADADRVAQVVTNLLGNALRACAGGGDVTVTVTSDHERVTIRVADTGVGISPADVERIFDRFHRVGGADRRDPGSGIGLTIARGIMRGHGGDLVAQSAGAGHGATFTAWLPQTTPVGS